MSAERSRPWNNPTPLPNFKPLWEGQFDTFDDWVNHARRALTDRSDGLGVILPAFCIDTKGRRCHQGVHFMRARDEGTFPIRYFFEGTAP